MSIQIEWWFCAAIDMWQFRVEIEHSIAYFARIAAFEALYRTTSIKGRAHTRCVNVAST